MASTLSTTKPSKGRNQLSFPPLVAQFRPSGQEPTWPGQEYTRRTRLKTHLDPTHSVSNDFVDEMKELLGDNYAHFEEAMKPSVSHGVSRGKPPAEKGVPRLSIIMSASWSIPSRLQIRSERWSIKSLPVARAITQANASVLIDL